eukprot:m.27399 g.27399  ORF g.27399 m.27399 type:complete len:872 (+) comp4409_c0_seq1:61-2676(+)
MADTRVLLPKDVRPTHYTVSLTPNLETFVFTGTETIAIKVATSTARVVLHSNDIKIESASWAASADEGVPTTSTTSIEYNEKEETAVLVFPDALPVGDAVLKLTFEGVLNDKMAGFYRSKYINSEGKEKHAAVTQFEATDARRAFPCWDEPAVKARFDVTLTVPEDLVALGNMPAVSETSNGDGTRTVKFDTTPIMSTYLVAFVVGEFEKVSGATKDGVAVAVWTPVGVKAEGEFPLQVAIKTLEYFSDFFAQPYPLPKMDMIAIADFAAGAMENWGLVTYRSTYLLYNPERTSLQSKTLIAYVVGHELAHQWFGNLVTMEWWTHLWLNEGFATWVGWLAVDHMFPEWRIWDRFVGDELERALELDSLRSSHAIEVECKNSADVNEIFDAISYSKGASLIRMLADIIGIEAFQSGLRDYIQKHKYSNAESTDLWAALTKSSGRDVSSLMSVWTKQTGYPVVSLTLDTASGAVSGTQQRFFATGADASDTSLWPVALGMSGPSVKESKPSIVDTASFATGVTLGDGEYVKANRYMTGVYRVMYDAALLKRLGPATAGFDCRDRYSLVSDAFACASAGYGDTAAALSLLLSFSGETAENVTNLMSHKIGDLQSLLFAEPEEVQARLGRYALHLFGPMAKRVGMEPKSTDTHADAMLRSMLVARAGKLGDATIVAECKERFAKFIAGDDKAIHPDIRSAVYSVVLKHGDKTEFDALIALYDRLEAQDEKVAVLRSLGSSLKPEVHQAVVDFALSDKVRSQDVVSPIASLAANPAAKMFLWKWFTANYSTLHSRFYSGSFLLGRIITNVCSGFATDESASEIEAFFDGCGLDKDAVKRAIQQSVESVRASALWLRNCREGVAAFLEQGEKDQLWK